MGRRIDVQADNVRELLGEGRVVRELDVLPAVRAETMGLSDRLYCRCRTPATFAIALNVHRAGFLSYTSEDRLVRGASMVVSK
jgi:hypothetical protein